MSTGQVQIRNLNDLRRYKMYLRKRMLVRQKILNVRLRKVERELTIPNITRELFRDSGWEVVLPPLADYLARKLSGKSIAGIIAGLFASLGSLKLFSSRKKNKKKAVKESRKGKDTASEEEQLFI